MNSCYKQRTHLPVYSLDKMFKMATVFSNTRTKSLWECEDGFVNLFQGQFVLERL